MGDLGIWDDKTEENKTDLRRTYGKKSVLCVETVTIEMKFNSNSEDDSWSSQKLSGAAGLRDNTGILHRGTSMDTYNGGLLIPLTALQDLSYGATAMPLVRPLPGFTQGYTNTPPLPFPPAYTQTHTPRHKIIHTHLWIPTDPENYCPHTCLTDISCVMRVISAGCSADVISDLFPCFCPSFSVLFFRLHFLLLLFFLT